MSNIVPKGWEKEIAQRETRVAEALRQAGADAILISGNANLYYITGRVIAGYVLVTAQGEVKHFVRRPVELEGDNVAYIRKPEQIAEMLGSVPGTLALEYDMSYADIMRLQAAFPGANFVNGSAIMRSVRAVKSPFELDLIRRSGVSHAMSYKSIPHIFSEGMSDVELQVELEHRLRLDGCLGLFRISGQSMELFMGNILAGDNADNPAPYDFAMGGAGLDPSLPVGSNGTQIKPGMSVMVDMCGNFTGYMTDMTRCFYVGSLSDLARKAHNTSIAICHELQHMAKPGTPTASMYEKAVAMAEEAGLTDYFMGHAQKAGFVGHGVGIEVNELPVLAPKSRDVLAVGNVIAIEPKFVIPSVGAVGIENTYVVTEDGLDVITDAPEDLKELY